MKNIKKSKILAVSVLFFAALITTGVHAKVMHQECDGEQKTCCVAENMSGVPPMWVNEATCPKGMVDDITCAIQYGCKQNDEPELN